MRRSPIQSHVAIESVPASLPNVSMGGSRVSNLGFVGRRERGGPGGKGGREIGGRGEARGQTHEVEATAH